MKTLNNVQGYKVEVFFFFFFLLFNFNETASYLINEAKTQPNTSTRLLVFILILNALGGTFPLWNVPFDQL